MSRPADPLTRNDFPLVHSCAQEDTHTHTCIDRDNVFTATPYCIAQRYKIDKHTISQTRSP